MLRRVLGEDQQIRRSPTGHDAGFDIEGARGDVRRIGQDLLGGNVRLSE